MIQLGLSGFYHDSAAAIVIDGKVICAIEEEKLSGIKHDSSFPLSTNWTGCCCHLAGGSISTKICFSCTT